jgi:hypothetical protein
MKHVGLQHFKRLATDETQIFTDPACQYLWASVNIGVNLWLKYLRGA